MIKPEDLPSPEDMPDVELLECHDSYTRLSFRNKSEQEYSSRVRQEILKRMNN